MSGVNGWLDALLIPAYAAVVAERVKPNPLWDSMLPEDRDCPYPLTGAVNVPLPFDERTDDAREEEAGHGAEQERHGAVRVQGGAGTS